MVMGNTNGWGGNFGGGASTSTTQVLDKVNDALNSMLKSLDNVTKSLNAMSRAAGGAGRGGSGGVGAGAPAAAGGGMDGMSGAMGALSMAGPWGRAAAVGLAVANTGMNVAQDGLPTVPDAIATKQMRYQYGLYQGAGGPTLQGVTASMRGINPYGMSSPDAYNQVALNMSAMSGYNMVGATSVTQRMMANNAANALQISGLDAASYSQAFASMHSAESINSAMMFGIQTDDIATGKPRSDLNIANQISSKLVGSSAPSDRFMETAFRDGGNVDLLLKEMGWAPGSPEYQNMREQILLVMRGRRELGKTNIRQKDLEQISGYKNGEINPSGLMAERTSAEAGATELGVDATYEGVKFGTDRVIEYFENLGMKDNWGRSVLDQLARISGAKSAYDTTEGGVAGVEGTNFLTNLWGSLTKPSASEITGNSEGEWNVSNDQVSRIHAGEMVVPARIAEAVRKDLKAGGRPTDGTPHDVSGRGPSKSRVVERSNGGSIMLDFTVNVQSASEEEAVRMARRVQEILRDDHRLASVGRGE